MSLQGYLILQLLHLLMRRFGHLVSSQNQDEFSMDGARRLWASSGRFIRLPRGARVVPVTACGVPAHWIIPRGESERRVLLYLHGGAWVYGWAPLYDTFVARLARASKARALGIDYRLAPEHPYPAALDDCLSAYNYLLDQGIPAHDVVVMGDSAGGNLTPALLLTLKERGMPLPSAGVCLSPFTDMAWRGESFRENARNDIIPASLADFAIAAYAPGRDLRDPHLSPFNGDLGGLPPLLIQVGGGELLVDDARAFAARAAACGVDVTLTIYPGMWHVWQAFAPIVPEANRAVAEIGRFVQARVCALPDIPAHSSQVSRRK
jgi:epsilon-lactone hydrolase